MCCIPCVYYDITLLFRYSICKSQSPTVHVRTVYQRAFLWFSLTVAFHKRLLLTGNVTCAHIHFASHHNKCTRNQLYTYLRPLVLLLAGMISTSADDRVMEHAYQFRLTSHAFKIAFRRVQPYQKILNHSYYIMCTYRVTPQCRNVIVLLLS